MEARVQSKLILSIEKTSIEHTDGIKNHNHNIKNCWETGPYPYPQEICKLECILQNIWKQAAFQMFEDEILRMMSYEYDYKTQTEYKIV